MGKLLWSPIEEQKSQSEINKIKQYIERRYQLVFSSCHDLWRWSTSNVRDFWKILTTYFNIKFYSDFTSMLNDPADNGSSIGAEWFSGATLNYAEHAFRCKKVTDNSSFAHSNGFLQY
jgi:acetoacetyl-CoA synthetase